jgi:hypothetical protein
MDGWGPGRKWPNHGGEELIVTQFLQSGLAKLLPDPAHSGENLDEDDG